MSGGRRSLSQSLNCLEEDTSRYNLRQRQIPISQSSPSPTTVRRNYARKVCRTQGKEQGKDDILVPAPPSPKSPKLGGQTTQLNLNLQTTDERKSRSSKPKTPKVVEENEENTPLNEAPYQIVKLSALGRSNRNLDKKEESMDRGKVKGSDSTHSIKKKEHASPTPKATKKSPRFSSANLGVDNVSSVTKCLLPIFETVMIDSPPKTKESDIEELNSKSTYREIHTLEPGLWASSNKQFTSSATLVRYEDLAPGYQKVLIALLNCSALILMTDVHSADVIPYFEANSKIPETKYEKIFRCYENARDHLEYMEYLKTQHYKVFKFRKMVTVKICNIQKTETLMDFKCKYWKVFLKEASENSGNSTPISDEIFVYSTNYTVHDLARLLGDLKRKITRLKTLCLLCKPLTMVNRRYDDKRLARIVDSQL